MNKIKGIEKEFNLQLNKSQRGSYYIRVTNKQTGKVSYAYDNDAVIYVCTSKIYAEVTGQELVKYLLAK